MGRKTNQNVRAIKIAGIFLAYSFLAMSCSAPRKFEADPETTIEPKTMARISRTLLRHDGWPTSKLRYYKIAPVHVQASNDGVYLCTMAFTLHEGPSATRTTRKVPLLRCGERFWLATPDIDRNARRLIAYSKSCHCEKDPAHLDSLRKTFVPPSREIFVPHWRPVEGI